MFKPSKRQVNRQLFKVRQAVRLTLDSQLRNLCNEEERELSRQAYLSLCILFNSLHRHLLSAKQIENSNH